MKIIAVLVLLCPLLANAAPVAEITLRGGETVVLTDEACTFPPLVQVLPLRATWSEKGKVYEGCYVRRLDMGDVFVAFPEDFSTISIPLYALKRVSTS